MQKERGGGEREENGSGTEAGNDQSASREEKQRGIVCVHVLVSCSLNDSR